MIGSVIYLSLPLGFLFLLFLVLGGRLVCAMQLGSASLTQAYSPGRAPAYRKAIEVSAPRHRAFSPDPTVCKRHGADVTLFI